MYLPCIPIKTIALELDAYEKLQLAKGGGESFTELIRRAVLVEAPLTGAALQDFFQKEETESAKSIWKRSRKP